MRVRDEDFGAVVFVLAMVGMGAIMFGLAMVALLEWGAS